MKSLPSKRVNMLEREHSEDVWKSKRKKELYRAGYNSKKPKRNPLIHPLFE
jgi:hypothetical protein